MITSEAIETALNIAMDGVENSMLFRRNDTGYRELFITETFKLAQTILINDIKEKKKNETASDKQLDFIRSLAKEDVDKTLVLEFTRKNFNKDKLPTLTVEEASAVIKLLKGGE